MFFRHFALIAAALSVTAAHSQIKVGVISAATGPGASLGVPQKNTFTVMPSTLGGQAVTYVIVDDATDPATAVRLARKLVSEDGVDLIIGSGNVPTAAAISYIASETKTPQIALAPLTGEPTKNPWVFTVSLPTPLLIGAIADNARDQGTKTMGFIGYSDSLGDQFYNALVDFGTTHGYAVTTNERYARLDTSVTSQALRVVASKPDVVMLGGSGTQGALPHLTLRERGYKGPIYHSAAVVNPEFLRIGGKALEGALVSAGPVIVAEQLPDTYPTKAPGLRFSQAYEAKFGAGSRNSFSAYAWDAYLIADAAATVASKKSKPGTPAFREALLSKNE